MGGAYAAQPPLQQHMHPYAVSIAHAYSKRNMHGHKYGRNMHELYKESLPYIIYTAIPNTFLRTIYIPS